MLKSYAYTRFLENEGAERPLDMPPRPSLPPLLLMGLSFWLSCALLWPHLVNLDRRSCLLLALGAGLLCLICILVLYLFKLKLLIFCIAIGLVAGLCLCGAHAFALKRAQQEALASQDDSYTLQVLEDSSATTYGSAALCRLELSSGQTLCVQAYFESDAEPVYFGQILRTKGVIKAASETSAARLWEEGALVTYTVNELEVLQAQGPAAWLSEFRKNAVEKLAGEGEEHALLQALVCAWTEAYNQTSIKTDFTLCGLAHIVAVSGAHLAVVSSFVTLVLARLRLPRGLCILLQSILMLCYLALAAAPVSAVRAYIMSLSLHLSYFGRRRSAGLSSLGLCMVAMLALSPQTALSVSFALSALSTLGIGLFFSLFSFWLRKLCSILPGFIRDALALTFASSVLAQGFSCALFSQLPLISPLANAVSAVLVGPVCTLGIISAVLCVLLPLLGTPLLWIALFLAQLMCGMVGLLASLPYASIAFTLPAELALFLSFLLAGGLWLIWPAPLLGLRLKLAGAACASLSLVLILIFFLGPRFKPDELIMLEVGQGDAFLLRSQGAAVLIDTGNQDSSLRQALARNQVPSLNAVIISHADDDHCGSLSALKGATSTQRVCVAAETLSCSCNSCQNLCEDAQNLVGQDNLVGLSVGDTLEVGRFSIEVLWPYSFQEEGGNADSLCLLISYDANGDEIPEAVTLMVGDAEAEQLEALIADGLTLPLDIYKVGHHGSKAALSQELAQELSPRISLISVGENNSYGHPADITLNYLEEAGSQIYCSDERGDVSCRFSSTGIEVFSLR